jgi:DNA-directed RNA polymerase subunit RPC12/RpoP
MAEFVSLTCPACGARLKETEDKDRFFCDYCGIQQLFDRKTQTVSYVPAKSFPPQEPEDTRESPSELASKRLRQEITDLEIALEEIGRVDSPWGVAVCTICTFLPQIFLAGASAFGVWAVGSLTFLDGYELLMTRLILGIVVIAFTAGAIKVIKTGAEFITHSRRRLEKRKRILKEISDSLNELNTYRNAAFSTQVERTTLELASEMAISRLKKEITDLKNRLMEISSPESKSSILISMILSFLFLGFISYWLLSWASSQELPFNEFPFLGEINIPSYVWIALGILGLAFTLLALKAVETGIEKWDQSNFQSEEQKRLDERLSLEQAELEKHQNAVYQMME